MSGAATAPGGDPSMEDILASIRKILNEEEAAPAAPAAEGTSPAEPEPLELTEAMLVATPPAEAAAEEAGETPVQVAQLEETPQLEAEPVAEPAMPMAAAAILPDAVPVEAPVPAPAVTEKEGLVAPATEAAAVALLGQLARSVAAERAAPVHRGGPSIEDVVREEVRPILKAWMDEHLPPLVERLVRAEIERVASRSLG